MSAYTGYTPKEKSGYYGGVASRTRGIEPLHTDDFWEDFYDDDDDDLVRLDDKPRKRERYSRENQDLREEPVIRKSSFGSSSNNKTEGQKTTKCMVRHDIDDEPMKRWVKVGNYWECPKCNMGVDKITGTLEGDYVTFNYCPNCGTKL